MSVLEWLSGLGGTAIIAIASLKAIKTIQQESRLRKAFYYLLEVQDGSISLIQLAAAAQVNAEPAKEYLESQARTFSVLPEVDSEGNTFYQFPKVERSLLPAELDEW